MGSGIYQILNIANGKIYVGSSGDLEARIEAHKRDLKSNRHSNFHLQGSYNKYGVESFVYLIIEYCHLSELLDKEQYWISNLSVVEYGYNICPTAGSPMLGRKHSEEARKKIAEAGKGRKFSKEHRQKISEALTGENNYMWGRSGKRNPMYGKSHSEETRHKVSLANSGINNGMYGQTGDKNPMYGKTGVDCSRSKIISFKGETKNISEWSEEIGISRSALGYRLKNWSLEEALTTPKILRGKNKRS